MFIAEVIGVVVSTCKEKNLEKQKLLIVRDIYAKNSGQSMIVVDPHGAGIGEFVLIAYDGGVARQVIGSEKAPINGAVVGIIDYPEEFL